jgi:hypothetical protein
VTGEDIYSDSTTLAQLLSVAAKEMVRQARALGLTWSLRIGEVTLSSLDFLTMTLDGDSVPIGVVNMTGAPLVSGSRYYVLLIPPAGNFVVGSSGLAAPVGASLARSAVQSIPNNLVTTLVWDTVNYDSGGVVGSAPRTQFTVPEGRDGVWVANVAYTQTPTGGARNFLDISLNGTSNWRQSFIVGEGDSTATMMAQLVSGDYIFVNAYQNSGGAVNATARLAFYRMRS